MGLKSPSTPKPLTNWTSIPVKSARPDAQLIEGSTIIDKSKACSIPLKTGELPPLPSLLRGEPTCRECYAGPPCSCGGEPYETEVDVYWTSTSKYLTLSFIAVKKCENIVIKEAKRLGMSCVIIRKEQHNTFTQRTKTGRKTGRYLPADWHITTFLGDGPNKLLLQGHTYVFMGKKNVPQGKLLPGHRTTLEPHELMQRLTLKDAQPQVYWGMNGSCGYT